MQAGYLRQRYAPLGLKTVLSHPGSDVSLAYIATHTELRQSLLDLLRPHLHITGISLPFRLGQQIDCRELPVGIIDHRYDISGIRLLNPTGRPYFQITLRLSSSVLVVILRLSRLSPVPSQQALLTRLLDRLLGNLTFA